MRKLQTITVIAGLLFLLTASAQNKQAASGTNKIEPFPRDLEIQLALSALPPHLRDNATVYVLNPDKGFEVARKGINGFYTLVARTGDDTFRGSWPFTKYRDDILYPISFDEAGAKAQLRVFFDAAEMQAKGTPPEELKKIIQESYRTYYYKAPERAGVSYMLSPILRTYVNPDANDNVATANVPHVMHYAPNVSNEDVGGAIPTPEQLHYFSEHGRWQASPDPFVILHGPHGYFVQFVGVTERTAINKEYEEMLARLCKIKEVWCLPQYGAGIDAPTKPSHSQRGEQDMNDQNYSISFAVDQSPEQVFNAINNVRGWWSEEIEGGTDKLGDEFTYRYKNVHHCKMKLIEVIPHKKVVWTLPRTREKDIRTERG